jgi:hypothetical protein
MYKFNKISSLDDVFGVIFKFNTLGLDLIHSPNACGFNKMSNPIFLGLIIHQTRTHVVLTRCEAQISRARLQTKLEDTRVLQNAKSNSPRLDYTMSLSTFKSGKISNLIFLGLESFQIQTYIQWFLLFLCWVTRLFLKFL